MPRELTIPQIIEQAREAIDRNDPVGALRLLDDAAERKPEYADVQNLLGACRSLLGDWDAALEAFDHAVRTNPDYVEAHLNRAITLNEVGRYDEAREAFERAAESASQQKGGRFPPTVANKLANTHRDLGDLYASAGGFEEALVQYEHARELRPHFVDIRNQLARVLIDLGRFDEAAAELEDVLAINPGYTAARVSLGLARFREGNLEAAERAWQQCDRQRPDDPQVRSFLRLVRERREEDRGE